MVTVRVWNRVVLTAVASALAMIGSGCAGEQGPDLMEQKVDPIVLEQLDETGAADYWLVMDAEPVDLGGAAAIRDWNERGEYVYQRLTEAAADAQASARATLDEQGATYEPFWVVNAVHVTGGDKALTRELAADSTIKRIQADDVFEIEPPMETEVEPGIDGVEWGIERIGAPQVWQDFGVLGEGIVIANIDTGVEYTHSALVSQYRGNQGDGTFAHDYNWYDPSHICAGGIPCDNNNHGTHTMGTMLGDDGGNNQIGVAPGATWIAAKGCEYSSCSTGALLAAGQWMLAPTDRNGQNPRPDLRPHIVNNSWGGGRGNTFYQQTVDAWTAAGIFPAFSAGNSGSSCGSANSPGDYSNSYATGAFDINGNIAYFSSRGPSVFGDVKPDIAAPGVNVRSSARGNSYRYMSGTSMASPHTAGAVALVWAAAPSLIGDIEGTRELLGQTATDVSALSCGGTAEYNNVFGQGQLNAFAAVDAAPRGPTGTLAGIVRDADGQPLQGATVIASGERDRERHSDAAGAYSMRLAVGTYDVTVRAYGYLDQTVTGHVIVEDQVTTADFTLTEAPRHVVSGHVRDDQGAPVRNSSVALLGAPIPPTVTDANGFFQFADVPQGQYRISATGDGRCIDSAVAEVVIDGNGDLEIALPRRTDAFGYTCSTPEPDYIEASQPVSLYGDDRSTAINLPFSFPFYGQSHNRAYICTNGFISFMSSTCPYYNRSLPSSSYPNGAIYPYWDDLYVDYSGARVYTGVRGSAPNRQFVIEWRNIRHLYSYYARFDLEIVLHESSGAILMQYRNIDGNSPYENAALATIGIENQSGNIAFQYSYNEPVLSGPEFAIEFSLPPSATVHGVVTDHNDGLPVMGATVRALDASGNERQRVYTSGDGTYNLRLPLATHTIEASAHNYGTDSFEVVLDQADEVIERDFSLRTARAEVDRTELDYIVVVDDMRAQTVTLSNSGSRDMTWNACPMNQFGTCVSMPWLIASPDAGELAPGESIEVDIIVDGSAIDVGVYDAIMGFDTNSGRQPRIEVAVHALVVAYRQGINAGDCSGSVCQSYIDRNGDVWAADQMWQEGSWGHVLAGSTKATNQAIANTTEEALYQTQRVDPYAYRFDGLPGGVYEVELEFAEITPNQGPGERLFDVIVENETLWPAYDIAYEAGGYTAHSITYHVQPTDGTLDIRLAQRLGSEKPVINALRVTHRPDL